jgi:nitrite reductase/ring-hydroxylating ferredoxin subunit
MPEGQHLPYPNGWFAVAFSSDLKPEAIVRRRLMGEEIILWRTRTGAICGSRPYCPHLGAHLGHGGRVRGERLVCPFHGFAYDPRGICVATGYGTDPPRAKLDTLEISEGNNIIAVWWHAEGKAPEWPMPRLPEDRFSHYACTVDTLADHPQDIAENGLDTGHLPIVHRFGMLRRIGRLAQDGHRCRFDHATFRKLPVLGTLVFENRFELHGLGILIAHVTAPRLRTRFRIWILSTPIDPERIELRTMLSTDLPVLRRWAGRALHAFMHHDLRRDFPIWENKIHMAHPKLVSGDGPIMSYRRWAAGFYSEHDVGGGVPEHLRPGRHGTDATDDPL